MKATGQIKRMLLKILDFLFPSLMNIIWKANFLVYCHQNGYVIFDAKSEQEALDYLVK